MNSEFEVPELVNTLLSDEELLRSLASCAIPDPLTVMLGYERHMFAKGGLKMQSLASRTLVYGVNETELLTPTFEDPRRQRLRWLGLLTLPLSPSVVIINTRKLRYTDMFACGKVLKKMSVGALVIITGDNLETVSRYATLKEGLKIQKAFSNGNLCAMIGLYLPGELGENMKVRNRSAR